MAAHAGLATVAEAISFAAAQRVLPNACANLDAGVAFVCPLLTVHTNKT